MKTARLTSLVILTGAIAGGLVLDAAEDDTPTAAPTAVLAGVAIPAARAEPTLGSTWYCAGGTATEGLDADHVVLIANPTDVARTAVVTVLTGTVAPAGQSIDEPVAAGETTTTAPATTTTAAPTTTTEAPPPAAQPVELPPQGRVAVRLGDLVEAELAGAVVEVDGGQISVEHQVTGRYGQATAPCSTTASSTWSFPWGVTARGSRELLVFMNPFPDDATVDISFATNEGVRDPARFQGFVVPGQSVVGAFLEEDARRDQLSASVRVRGGRLIIDRIQTFDGTDGLSGMTVGLGVPTPAETWMFPLGETGEGLLEQVVVFNPNRDVAEVEVEVRLDDPEANEPPEPFELTIPPGRYSSIDLHAEERIPAGVGHALIVRSLNGVPVTAERINAAVDPAPRRGVAASTGSPVAAPTWYLPGGGPVEDELDEYLVVLNTDLARPATFDVTAFRGGQTIALDGLQDRTVAPGGRLVVRVGDFADNADLPLVVRGDRPIVVERGMYRLDDVGITMSMGIPLDQDVVVPDPLDG
jgi:hypothetical protein